MSTYKILSNVLDFLEQKNALEAAHKSPPDEELETGFNQVTWRKKYPKVESPEEDSDPNAKKRIERDICDTVKYNFYARWEEESKTWIRSLDITISHKNNDKSCEIPLYWYNRFHPTVLRAWWIFYKIERANTKQGMLDLDKEMAKVDSSRIDDILQGVIDSGNKAENN